MVYAVRTGGAPVEIVVYNTAGQRVRTLVNGTRPQGRHEALWDGRDESGSSVSAGVYFFRSVVGDQSTVTRIVYMR
jgi:flagellar hook assembly protein FlgD